MSKHYSQLQVIDHPLVQDSLSHLRSVDTKIQKFRQHSNKICQYLFLEAVRGLSLAPFPVVTPLMATTAQKLSDDVVVVPVLRAGLAMLFGALEALPKATVGFVGLERDESTAEAREYYWKLPPISPQSVVVVTDPMLATGGSLAHLLRSVSPLNPKSLVVVSVIAAPEGVERLIAEFPNITIYTAALDERLNEKKYIVPGLGDYGDRYFGT